MPFGMYNCNFEAINWVLNKKKKKLEMIRGAIHWHYHYLSDALVKI